MAVYQLIYSPPTSSCCSVCVCVCVWGSFFISFCWSLFFYLCALHALFPECSQRLSSFMFLSYFEQNLYSFILIFSFVLIYFIILIFSFVLIYFIIFLPHSSSTLNHLTASATTTLLASFISFQYVHPFLLHPSSPPSLSTLLTYCHYISRYLSLPVFTRLILVDHWYTVNVL